MSDFLLTLAVRIFFGALFGVLGAIFYGWRSILGSMGRSEFPALQLVIGAAVGVVLSVATIPRRDWPWNKR